jgi:hypothetical protein
MHTQTHTQTHRHTHTHAHACAHARTIHTTHTRTHTHTPHRHTRTGTLTHTETHTRARSRARTHTRTTRTQTNAHRDAYTQIHTSTRPHYSFVRSPNVGNSPFPGVPGAEINTFALRDIPAGEELLDDYLTFGVIGWYEEICHSRGVESLYDAGLKYS